MRHLMTKCFYQQIHTYYIAFIAKIGWARCHTRLLFIKSSSSMKFPMHLSTHSHAEQLLYFMVSLLPCSLFQLIEELCLIQPRKNLLFFPKLKPMHFPISWSPELEAKQNEKLKKNVWFQTNEDLCSQVRKGYQCWLRSNYLFLEKIWFWTRASFS